jgi:hypothetical protein
MKKFKDTQHLLRMAFIFLAGTAVFLIVRAFLVPPSFGEYGHYRGDSISEVAASPVSFAGHQTCETCHADILEMKQKGKHVGVNCEACHGPLAKHADDPGTIHPPKLDTAVLCVRCHEANVAKPAGFPQIQAAEHMPGLTCETCHQPHSPAIASGGKK